MNKQQEITISNLQQKNLLKDKFKGLTDDELAKKYELEVDQVVSIAKKNMEILSEEEREYFRFFLARENSMARVIKDKAFEFIKTALEEAEDLPNKMYYFSKVKDILEHYDKVGRLNMGMSTENKTQTNRNIDINELVKQLNTPEEKRDFLKNQLNNNQDDRG